MENNEVKEDEVVGVKDKKRKEIVKEFVIMEKGLEGKKEMEEEMEIKVKKKI